ncbi:MAG: zinc metalloprotease HtpX [Gaiellaceae bacterium]
MRRKAYGRDFGLSSRMFLTIFLLGALYVGFFALLLQSGASYGVMIVLLGAFAFLQYFTSDKIALASSGAKVVTPEQAPDLHAMVDRLCAMSDLPKPRVAVIPTDVPNAFATGRSPKRSVVAVTEGLWKRLDPPEIEGVIAHELAHIANRDVAVMTFASFFSHVASLLIWFGGGLGRNREGPPIWLIALVVYFVSYFLILALSRYREFAADRGAALVTGAPENLMSALQKIASDMTRIPQRDLRQMESLNAFYIIPTNVKRSAATLFMTHPPLEKRLARLAAIAQEMGRPVTA